MALISPVEAFERRRAEIARTTENAAREAIVFTTCKTKGLGQHLISKEMVFNVSFSEEPRHTYTYTFTDMHKFTAWPRSQGWVASWTRDAKGLYTGCHVAVAVDTAPGVAGDFPYEIKHVFGFFAIALKFVPSYLV